ncbi:Fic family protein [Labedaea rhizosphaerae]|uniref:Fic/DOC family protein n=1 Tax=Labedaea rhizosphaerae TaxID=598644 RepID=A0A4R6S7K7_LABRH|nr:Fic family protein [Labedaea rhizosphaerae]TDP94806.1 Fic/DOC family protein [Labedaea rhizosphaerae]
MTDHLSAWLAVRDSVAWQDFPADDAPVEPRRDGAAHDIETFDRPRDPARADRLLTALALVRATRGPLTVERLSAWQSLVLGSSRAPFRGGPAYAKSGAERYDGGPEAPDRFRACLAESAEPGVAVAARAARVYLDVCFFHPFADGNARSAFLAWVFVLAAAGIAVDAVGPVRRPLWYADDPADAMALTRVTATLIAATRRRAVG